MVTLTNAAIEDLQLEIHDLYRQSTELRKKSALLEQVTRATENSLSLLLLAEYGLERGTAIDMEVVDVGDSDNITVRAAHGIMFVDGITQYFDEPFVILTSKMDSYTPFSDMNVSSSEYTNVGHRIRIPLERIQGE